MAEEVKRSTWQTLDYDDMPVLEVPGDFVAFLSDRKRILAQKKIKVQQLGSGRFQVNQYNDNNQIVRTIVFDLQPAKEGEPRQVKVSGHQILMVSEKTPEDIKDAMLSIFDSIS